MLGTHSFYVSYFVFVLDKSKHQPTLSTPSSLTPSLVYLSSMLSTYAFQPSPSPC